MIVRAAFEKIGNHATTTNGSDFQVDDWEYEKFCDCWTDCSTAAERDRQTNRERKRDTDEERDRETETQRQACRQIQRQSDRESGRVAETMTE